MIKSKKEKALLFLSSCGASFLGKNKKKDSILVESLGSSRENFKLTRGTASNCDDVTSSVRRMVLDPKVTSLHSDYGSFDRPLGAGEGHERDVEAAVDGSSNGMAQSSDVYQRQPLLPGAPTKGKDKWAGVASGSDYYVDDEDEKIDSLRRHPGIPNGSGNGVVKLDIPAPLREEPRFPKEKWKTFLGKDKARIFPLLSIYIVLYTYRCMYLEV